MKTETKTVDPEQSMRAIQARACERSEERGTFKPITPAMQAKAATVLDALAHGQERSIQREHNRNLDRQQTR